MEQGTVSSQSAESVCKRASCYSLHRPRRLWRSHLVEPKAPGPALLESLADKFKNLAYQASDTEDAMISADPDRISQILWNLLLNAQKIHATRWQDLGPPGNDRHYCCH